MCNEKNSVGRFRDWVNYSVTFNHNRNSSVNILRFWSRNDDNIHRRVVIGHRGSHLDSQALTLFSQSSLPLKHSPSSPNPPKPPPTPHEISPQPHSSLARWIRAMFGIAKICARPSVRTCGICAVLGVAVTPADAILKRVKLGLRGVSFPLRTSEVFNSWIQASFLWKLKSTHFVPSWGENRAISTKRMKLCGQKYCAQILVDYMVTYKPDFDRIWLK